MEYVMNDEIQVEIQQLKERVRKLEEEVGTMMGHHRRVIGVIMDNLTAVEDLAHREKLAKKLHNWPLI